MDFFQVSRILLNRKFLNNSAKLLSWCNCFGGGIFLSIGLFHLLPEANELLEDAFSEVQDKNLFQKLPVAFMLSFTSYSAILFIEKVLFDSHALIDHGHEHGHGHDHDDHDESKKVDVDAEYEDEMNVKNLLSGRSKVASFVAPSSEVTKMKNASFAALSRFSMTQKEQIKKEQDELFIDKNSKDDETHDHEHDHENEGVKGGSLTAYMLLVALSIHSIFEGLALGVKSESEAVHT